MKAGAPQCCGVCRARLGVPPQVEPSRPAQGAYLGVLGAGERGSGPRATGSRGPSPTWDAPPRRRPQDSPGAPISLLLAGDKWPERVRKERGCETVQAESSGKARALWNLNTGVNESSALERAESNYLLVSFSSVGGRERSGSR